MSIMLFFLFYCRALDSTCSILLETILISRYPLTILSGKGCTLTTTDGKEYLDCVSGIATCALGHNNDALTKAVCNQMNKVHHVSNLYFIPEQAALANWLCENSGGDKAFFCNSGAEANEAAIKCARRHAYNRGITVRLLLGAKFRIPSSHGVMRRLDSQTAFCVLVVFLNHLNAIPSETSNYFR
jgi:acetylornithine/succinyldiaminopimelate/putrescine aminotransferase